MSKTLSASAKRKKVFLLTETAMLVAVLCILGFTKLGFLAVGPLEITFMMVPVIVGAVTGGVGTATLLGTVFGIISFIQCFTGSPLGTILAAASIPKCLIVCLVPRVLTGFFCGLVFKVCLKHDKKQSWSFPVASGIGSLLNTVLFLGALMLFFGSHTFSPEQAAAFGAENVMKLAIAIAVGFNAPIELLVNAILGSAIGKGVSVALKRTVK